MGESVLIGRRGYAQVMETKTVMYDADGNETDNRAQAVRGEVVELDDDGNVVNRELAWQVDDRALHGDVGEVATRPGEES
jgi:hypothetical protein